MSARLGISGAIAKKFLQSEITPLLALVGLFMGIFAVMITPREEEPQINVTLANVFIPFPGATALEVEHLVSTPAEQVLAEIEGIEHVYSVSRPGMSIVTVQFEVGEDYAQSLVKLYNKVFSNDDWLPKNPGIGKPLIKPKGIDDVPVLTLTLWTEDEKRGAYDLQQVAHTIEAELKRVPGTRDIYTIGGPDRVVHVVLDPQRMSAYGVDLQQLRAALASSNVSNDAGNIVRDNSEILVQAGEFLSNANDVADLVVGLRNNTPVFLRDVATVTQEADQAEQYVWFGTGPAAGDKNIQAKGNFPAVTVAIAKKPGSNAIEVTNQVINRFEQLKGIFIPDGINVTVTRNYGDTANEKAMTLIKKLVFATAVVVLLVFFALGWREALIVGAAIFVTLAITLFASWAWGFTLNRVSLFALIFSIGILVDDAIVVVENIHRHMAQGGKKLVEVIPVAVDEVGGPTILATFTVVAALLPMAFVSGLMGPYMSPIPINASIGMVISLAVAFIFTPWLTLKVLGKLENTHGHDGASHAQEDKVYVTLLKVFERYVRPFLRGNEGRSKRWGMLWIIIILILASVALAGAKLVVLKMLPFDNKSEFQVVVDMPEGTTVEQTARVMTELGEYLATVPDVTDYQAYVGTASPINFNGLVRQYYLRSGSNVGDIQVNLRHKSLREFSSHEIAFSMRAPLEEIAQKYNANVKVVEVPPGPPVQAPLVAEVYGLNYEGQIEVAKQIEAVFKQTADIVDVDLSVETSSEKWIIRVDKQKAALMGVSQQMVTEIISAALRGEDVSYLHAGTVKYPIPVRLELPVKDKAELDALLSMKVRGESGQMVSLSDIASVVKSKREYSIYHKDLLPVVFVTADLAGNLDSPLYGMFDIRAQLAESMKEPNTGDAMEQYMINQPQNPYRFSLKWDGEWQVTYETFRDMGIAYSVGLLLIYLLVVAQFRSYMAPLIIMAPIPLTIIGVMPGHALLGSQFTATSMIGMIALAGIIVRNSILLVDFINEEVNRGVAFQDAVLRAGAVRAKPIALTALAAILGAVFILDDPIFNGLAISLIFGILVSTVLTLVVIPVMYYAFNYKKFERA